MSLIAVFVEHHNRAARPASLEALGAAQQAGGTTLALLCGPGAALAAATLGAHGSARAVALENTPASPDALAQALAQAVRQAGAKAFLAAATSTGKDLAPRVAALLDSTLFSDCTGLANEGGALRALRPTLAGKLIATQSSSSAVFCATLRRNAFPSASGSVHCEVTQADAATDFLAILRSISAKTGGKLDVSEAPIVVSGGRGMKGPEHFQLLEELAAAFGNAAVGASRAVVDAGWRPHDEQVGQTGKTIAPQLYIAVGISGAIQHLAGMRTSKVIVAINKDKDAPIFKVADYGLVGDAFEILPALTQAVRALRAKG